MPINRRRRLPRQHRSTPDRHILRGETVEPPGAGIFAKSIRFERKCTLGVCRPALDVALRTCPLAHNHHLLFRLGCVAD